MTPSLATPELEVLRKYSTPTVANAIELFELRPRTEGYLPPGLNCLLPDAPPVVGYAATCVVSGLRPEAGRARDTCDYWEHVASLPAPRISVVQDIDDVPGTGCFWGEVNSNIHLALQCTGTVTNGGIRDLPEMRKAGFQALYGQRSVSHGYIHIKEFGSPVTILGTVIRPGDLLQADEHGVLIIPIEVLPELEAAVLEMERRERPVIRHCQSSEFDRSELWNLVVQNLRDAPPFESRLKRQRGNFIQGEKSNLRSR
ncbi:MAG: RraA family protein [Bryobacteraceae bacterium]